MYCSLLIKRTKIVEIMAAVPYTVPCARLVAPDSGVCTLLPYYC